MTTTLYFIRHAPHEHQNRVHVGRTPGVELGPDAPARLERLARRMAREPLDAVWASPIERAQQTSHAIADPRGLEVHTDPGLNEIETGDWTGRDMDVVDEEPATQAWNAVRSLNRIPGGEAMWEVQARMIGVIERARRAHPERHVALVSHADVIKAALLYLLQSPLDAHDRFALDPASVSTAVVGEWGAKVLTLNDTSHLADLNGAPAA